MKFVDLHLHTTHSDGTCSPKQVVIDAALIGSEVIAITDHDNTEGFHEAELESKKWGIKVLTGTEITTEDYHILGYNFDINNKNFQELLNYSRKCQEDIVKQRIEVLNKQGIPITLEKLKKLFPTSRLGKLNIAVALLLDQECKLKIGNLTLEEVFTNYLRNNPLMSKLDKTKQVTPEQAISEIHQAGGVAILAHPFKEIKDTQKELAYLLSLGLDGLEIQPNYNEQNKIYLDYAKQNNLLMTYGSDFHGARYIKRPLLKRENNHIPPFW
nr:hypothetical protein [Nanoarchaeum sp.]